MFIKIIRKNQKLAFGNLGFRCFTAIPHNQEKPSSEYDPSKILIETNQLRKLLEHQTPNVNILHVMLEPPKKMVQEDQDDLMEYYYKKMERGFINSAQVFPLIPFSNSQSGLSLTRPSLETFQQISRQLDMRKDDIFVCYDANIVHGSSRLAWILKTFGLKNVHVLNGTLDKWIKDEYPIYSEYSPDKQGPIRDRDATDEDYNFQPDDSFRKNYDSIKSITTQNLDEKTKVNLIDSRVPDFYQMVGHIPSSKNVPFFYLLNENLTFKSNQELIQIFKQIGDVEDPTQEEMVVLCQIGLTASSSFTALTSLGNTNVSLYDGSYQEFSMKNQQ